MRFITWMKINFMIMAIITLLKLTMWMMKITMWGLHTYIYPSPYKLPPILPTHAYIPNSSTSINLPPDLKINLQMYLPLTFPCYFLHTLSYICYNGPRTWNIMWKLGFFFPIKRLPMNFFLRKVEYNLPKWDDG